MTNARPPFFSYSLNHEDVMLNRVFGMQEEGFYVDVGAAHPLFENDTRALYNRGWHGINIEPTMAFFRELAAERPRDLNLNVAISDEPGELSFHEIVGTGLSTADAAYADQAAAKGFEVLRYTVPARTLCSILEEANVSGIDVLKVDVEGFELRAMRSNNWKKFRPRLILSEGTHPESSVRRDDGVAEYLAGQGYRHVYFDGLNDYYVEHGFAFPPGVFDCPLNVFDRFTPFAESQLATANVALKFEVERLLGECVRIEGEHTSEVANLERERVRIEGELWRKIEEAKTHITTLTRELRHTEASAKTKAGDLARAHAEIIAMRERGQALGTELDAAAMSCLLAERDKQQLLTLKSQMEADTLRIFQRLESVYASSSWRVTRPLRALARPRRTMRFVLDHFRLT